MYITRYLSLNSALACWYSECKKDILLSFFLIQGLPLIALAAWLFLPVYISAKVTQYLQWDLNSSCCFFSKFNIQYSISLKQIVSLSLQARHNTITHVFFRCTLYQSILERGLGAKGSESTWVCCLYSSISLQN